MSDALKQFAVELWSVDPEAGKMFDDLVKQLTVTGHFNKSVRNLLKATEWLAARTDKPVSDRLAMMEKLGQIRPPAIINLKHFTGWQ